MNEILETKLQACLYIYTHTHIHTPRVSGLFLACLESPGRGRRGSGCAWVQRITNPHSFLGGRSRVLRESPQRFPVQRAEGRGFAWQPDMGEGQWGPWPRTPIPCKGWGSSPEKGLAAMGSCVGSSDLSPPLDGAHRPKGVGRGCGTGTFSKVSSNSLGLSLAIC